MASISKKIFRANLETAMGRNGIYPAELHRRTGISESQISEYLAEKRVPNKKNLDRISTALGVTAGELTAQKNPGELIVEAMQNVEHGQVINLLQQINNNLVAISRQLDEIRKEGALK